MTYPLWAFNTIREVLIDKISNENPFAIFDEESLNTVLGDYIGKFQAGYQPSESLFENLEVARKYARPRTKTPTRTKTLTNPTRTKTLTTPTRTKTLTNPTRRVDTNLNTARKTTTPRARTKKTADSSLVAVSSRCSKPTCIYKGFKRNGKDSVTEYSCTHPNLWNVFQFVFKEDTTSATRKTKFKDWKTVHGADNIFKYLCDNNPKAAEFKSRFPL
jgi:hypothetical protein